MIGLFRHTLGDTVVTLDDPRNTVGQPLITLHTVLHEVDIAVTLTEPIPGSFDAPSRPPMGKCRGECRARAQDHTLTRGIIRVVQN